MQTWKDYIYNKFIPANHFEFTDRDLTSITIYHPPTGTSFYFYATKENWHELANVQYHNEKTKGWSGDYADNIPLNDEEIRKLNDFLKAPFETGWISEDIFVGGKHWKSKTYFAPTMSDTPFEYYSSELGYFSTILFPLYVLWAFIAGQKRVVKIEAVSKIS